MSIRPFSLVLAIGLVASETFGQQSDPELAKGIRLVEQGEYSQAILVLDAASRRLDRRPQDKGLAAQAYLHLGIAYVAEGQENLATASFQQALARDPSLSLSAFDVSPKVRELFEKARSELTRTRAANPKKGGSKVPLIVLGVAAAGGGVALAAGGGTDGSSGAPPTATCREGQFTAANLRFNPDSIACPPGTAESGFTYQPRLVFDPNNASAVTVSLSTVTVVTTCENVTPGFNCQGGPATFPPIPDSVSPGSAASVQVILSFRCFNDGRNSGSFAHRATINIPTSCGTLSLTSQNVFTTFVNR